MSPWLHSLAVVCLAVLFVPALICLYRLIVGPNAADRAVALDSLASVFIGIVCLLCILWNSTLYFEAVWILTLVGFLGSAAIARYMLNGRVMR